MSDKAKQVLSWIFGIAALIFLLMKDSSRDVKFVAAQAVTIWIGEIAANIVGKIPYVGGIISWVASIFFLVVAIMGLVKSCQGKQGDELSVPLIGDLSKKIFGKVIEG